MQNVRPLPRLNQGKSQRESICRVTELCCGEILGVLLPHPDSVSSSYTLPATPSPNHPAPPPPLSSITIHSPSCLSLLCQCPRQPIRSCQGPSASDWGRLINAEGLTWLCLWCLVVFFLQFFEIYLLKRIEAKPEGGSNQANVPLLTLIPSSCKESQKQRLRGERDAAIRRRQGDLCCTLKQ